MSAPRFEFGRNWQQFLRLMDEQRIDRARQSLAELMGGESLAGKRFLDAGCGSGLFSLAAHREGAIVHSFDYDPASVACAEALRQQYAERPEGWSIQQGSVLDTQFLRSLGDFDVVYAWGVLHHTGAMWQALENVLLPLSPRGRLVVSIYNDQGGASRRWRRAKQFYNRSPRLLQAATVLAVGAWWETRAALIRLVRGQNPLPFADWAAKKQDRGMSVWYDLVDWVGGYPFEVARPEEIFDFYRQRGLSLERMKTVGAGHGCNEFVFRAV